MKNINVRRFCTKLKEMFSGKIDVSDTHGDVQNFFITRSLAALSLMMLCDINEDNACLHITDGYNDIGIDAIYNDESQKILFLVQSKFRESGTGSIKQEEMGTFAEGIKRILNLDLEGANDKIKNKIYDIERALNTVEYKIYGIIVHTGNQYANNYVRRPIKELLKNTNDTVSTILYYEEYTFKEVFDFIAKGRDQSEICIDDVIIKNWGSVSNPYTSYYGVISAASIAEWYSTYGNKLFEKNIRFYKGSTDVNEGIKNVLINEPENFYYYNNGIKLLCKSIARKAINSTDKNIGIFKLYGVSLVNGAQTAGTIGTTFRDFQSQVLKAELMIQIIDLSKADEKLMAQITKLSNTQNRIEFKDFVYFYKEQNRIRTEMQFSNIDYIYKDGESVLSSANKILFEEAIVALACLDNNVIYSTLAKRNIGALFEDINKPPYKIFFNAKTNTFNIINSVYIIRKIESILQNRKEKLTGKEKLICIHGNRFISHCILQILKHYLCFDTGVIDIEDIDLYCHVDNFIDISKDAINKKYEDSYPANIFKNTAKCKAIKSILMHYIDSEIQNIKPED